MEYKRTKFKVPLCIENYEVIAKWKPYYKWDIFERFYVFLKSLLPYKKQDDDLMLVYKKYFNIWKNWLEEVKRPREEIDEIIENEVALNISINYRCNDIWRILQSN